MARWTGMVAPAAVALSLTAGCGWSGAGEVAAQGPDAVPWPTGVIARLVDAPSPSAYGWQRCASRPGSGTDTPAWAVGAVDPGDGIGVSLSSTGGGRIEAEVWRDGGVEAITVPSGTAQSLPDGWDPALFETGPEPPRWTSLEGADREGGVTLSHLRSLRELTQLFDLTATVADPVDPTVLHPLVERLPPDRADDPATLRLEGLPDGWPPPSATPDEVQSLGWPLGGSRGIWLLEAWTGDDDGDGVERIRYRALDERVSVETRFVPLTGVLDPEGGLVPPDCLTGPDTAAGADAASGDRLWFEPWPTDRTVPLQVSVDPDGRPYDVEVPEGITVSREHAGTLNAPDGELLVMDGNGVEVNPAGWADRATGVSVTPDSVNGDGVHGINLDIIWSTIGGHRDVLGVWLGPTDAEVVAWDPFESAYVTDGGVGGVVARSVLPLAEQLGPDEWWIAEPAYGEPYELWDLDGVPGDESLVFHNGWGDGGFPLSRGRDGDGQVVAVVIWHTGYPWRLAVPLGAPPADVTAREEELAACIAGTREVDPTGWCPAEPAD